MMTALAPMIRSGRSVRSPILNVAPSSCLPPVECWLGVKPSQAAKSRPLAKVSAASARATSAVAATFRPRRAPALHSMDGFAPKPAAYPAQKGTKNAGNELSAG